MFKLLRRWLQRVNTFFEDVARIREALERLTPTDDPRNKRFDYGPRIPPR